MKLSASFKFALGVLALVALVVPAVLLLGVVDRSVVAGPAVERRIVILMIGDGMGAGALDAASYYAAGAPGRLFMQSLPHSGKLTTVGLDGTTDSAAAATAMATGHFTLNGRVGITPDGRPLENLVERARRLGLATGVVTTASLPHGTPAAFTAHTFSRHRMPFIARQQIASGMEVLLGGGRSFFRIAPEASPTRSAGLETAATHDYAVVRNRSELRQAVADGVPRLLGLFHREHMPFTYDRPEAVTLEEMTTAAIEILDRNPRGFFLMAEGARIDMAGHQKDLPRMIGEVLAFDRAVRRVAEWVGERDDALLVVTADHETGGLDIVQPRGPNALPEVRWSSGEHTDREVHVFALGRGGDRFSGAVLDHRWIHAVALSRLEHARLTSPADPLHASR